MIISIYCPSGKVGKTTTSLALSKCAENANLKTCLVEFDFSPGDVPTILNLDSSRNILNALDGDYNTAVQKPDTENFHAIVAGYPDYYEKIDSASMIRILNDLDEKYDLVVVDIQPNFIPQCIDIFKRTDKIILVLNNDEKIIARTIGNLDWGIKSGFMDLNKFSILANKLDKKQKENYLKAAIDVNSNLNLPILNNIPLLKNFKGFSDERFLKYMNDTLNNIIPINNNKDTNKGFFSKLFSFNKSKEKTDSLPQLPQPNFEPNREEKEDMSNTFDFSTLYNKNNSGIKETITKNEENEVDKDDIITKMLQRDNEPNESIEPIEPNDGDREKILNILNNDTYEETESSDCLDPLDELLKQNKKQPTQDYSEELMKNTINVENTIPKAENNETADTVPDPSQKILNELNAMKEKFEKFENLGINNSSQQLEAENETLKKENTTLKTKIEELKKEMTLRITHITQNSKEQLLELQKENSVLNEELKKMKGQFNNSNVKSSEIISALKKIINKYQ